MRAFLKHLLWNSQERRLRALWRLLGQFVLFFAGTLLFAIVFGLVVVFVIRQLDPSSPAFTLEGVAGWVTIAGTFRTADPNQPFALAILGPLALFLCVGIYEEMLSRGYLL